jgi:hypothetical protein
VIDFYEALSVDSSRAMMDIAADAVGNSSKRFRIVYDLMSSQNKQIAMRAARVVDIASENYPDLLIPYLDQIIQILPKLRNSSVKRCLLHSLYRYISQISDEKLGFLVDCCFTWFPLESEDISVRYYCMLILYSITKNNPELKYEFALIISDMLPCASTGLKLRGQKIIKEIYSKEF